MNRPTIITILASFRTGSTALSDKLIVEHTIKRNLGEHYHVVKQQKPGFAYRPWEAHPHASLIIKVMPNQIIEPYFTELMNRSDYIFGIYRKNLVEQIASYYIAYCTDEWGCYGPSFFDNGTAITFDPDKLSYTIEAVLGFNKTYAEFFRPLCHQEFVYEEIKSSLLPDGTHRINTKPSNYKELCEKVKSML